MPDRNRDAQARLLRALAFALAAAFAVPARAQLPLEIEGQQFTVENDVLTSGNRDRAYTNGLRYAFLLRPTKDGEGTLRKDIEVGVGRYCELLRDVFGSSGGRKHDCNAQMGLAVGQLMYTPADIANRNFQPNDQPWMGWSYLAAFVQLHERADRHSKLPEDFTSTVEFAAGPVGRASLAKQGQRFWHNTLGMSPRDPLGWDNQLRGRLGWRASALHAARWRVPLDGLGDAFRRDGIGMDLVPHAGAALGNIRTALNAGATARLGWKLDDMPAGGVDTIPTIGEHRSSSGWSAYVFAGFDVRRIYREMALDDNEQRDRLNIVKRPWVDTWTAGFSVSYDAWRVTYASNRRAAEWRYRDGVVPGRHNFGMISLEWRAAFD